MSKAGFQESQHPEMKAEVCSKEEIPLLEEH